MASKLVHRLRLARRALARGEQGVAIIFVLAFMALAVPVTTGALKVASTLSNDSQVKTAIALDHYSLVGATQHAIYQMLYVDGYAESIPEGGQDVYVITLNGKDLTINLTKAAEPPGEPVPSWESNPPNNNFELATTKVVNPTTGTAMTPTVFTYTITVQNLSPDPQPLTKIQDGLPGGFEYVTSSTSGITTVEPSVKSQGGGGNPHDALIWDMTSQGIVIASGQWVTLTFEATATVPEGIYCNEAWARPGGETTGSGQTAKITIGSPSVTGCPREVLNVTKTVDPTVNSASVSSTYAYAITLTNDSAEDLRVQKITDLLSDSMSYGPSSTTGDMTTDDPNVSTDPQSGRTELRWSFSPSYTIPAGETRTIAFDADGTLASGNYYNEVWVDVVELTTTVYTWPTAKIEIMGVIDTQASGAGGTASSEVWVGDDTFVVTQMDIGR
jgi:uncharacterized repeat protein (TIGR01451 family)